MTAVHKHPELRGEFRRNEPMARHTTWRVGGPADGYYLPADIEDLAQFLRRLPPGEPLLWLGLGSNLLVRDGGIRGTVVATSRCLNGLERVGPGADQLQGDDGVHRRHRHVMPLRERYASNSAAVRKIRL